MTPTLTRRGAIASSGSSLFAPAISSRTPPGNEPQVFARQLAGGGRVVCFTGDLDRTYWVILHRDHCSLLANAVRRAHADPQPSRLPVPA